MFFMNLLLILPILISFLTSIIGIPFWIKKARQIGLVWRDMHKPEHSKKVAGSGGLITTLSFIIGTLLYIAITVFYFKGGDSKTITQILALLNAVCIALIIGFVDDILGWVRGGLEKKWRIMLLFFASIPLVVINAGESVMMGVDFGILYPLLIIPIGIIGAGATFNFLAGYNGLESGQGIIILTAISIVLYISGNSTLSLISLIMVASLLAFYIYNKNPAIVFPGDSLTYPVGIMIASLAILGNIEKIVVFFFIPYILETILKSRGKLEKQSFGRLKSDGSLDMPYDKIYGLEHLAIWILKKLKKNVRESDVVYLINGFQILIIILGFIIFI